MSEAELRKITTAHPEAILQEFPPPNFKIQIANGNLVPVRKQVLLRFYVAGKVFEETFLILPTMGTILIGMSFFEKYSVNLDIKNHLVHFPNHMMSMQVRQQKNNRFKTGLIDLCSSTRTVIPPLHQVMIQVHSDADISLTTGTVEGSPGFMRKTCLLVSPALVDLDEGKTTIQVTNPNNHTYTLEANTTLAHFRIPTPHQAANIAPMPVEHLNLITKYPDEAEAVINQLFVNPEMKSTKWYPTPETCSEPDKLNAIERRIYDEILALRELEKLDPSQSDEQRMNFLKNFNWDDSLLTPSQRLQVEELLVKYNSIFARHRFDIGMNTDFKVKLTPQHEEPVYSQSLPTPTNLKDDLLVELALMQEYGIITTLPHSKYSSPIFAQRKPNGKLRILVDLRRINHLIKNDYGEHNHPVTTIADAAQHMAGKKYFCKLDCSQAYHCIPMADEQSVQLLSFNFGSRTFAFLRLAQGLNRSLSAFTGVIREYLDPLVKADRCAQYVDDIGIAAHSPEELITNLELVFQQLHKAGLKLSMSKCEFGQKQIEYLGKTISSTGIAPIEKRVTDYLTKLKPPNSVKALQRYLGFVNFYRSYIPRLADKTCCLQELIKKDVPFKLNQQHKDAIFEINESLLKATKVSLKLPLPDKQLVIMCDASEHAAGYVLLIEDYADPSVKHTYAPVAFGSKKFQGGQMSLTMYAKEFLAMHFAFDEFGHILWGAKKPIIVMTDNKALTRFFQAKHIPPSLWNFCDQTLQFNFLLAHVPGVENPAADYLSRLEIRPEDRVHLKLTDTIPIHRIEIDIASRTPKQEEDEPDYFPASEPLRCKRQKDVKEMKLATGTDVAHDDGKGMKFTNCERTAASDDFATDNHLTYRLTDVDEPIQLSQFIRKVSLSHPVMSQVSPAEGIDLIQVQKNNWVIQKMIRFLEGTEILQHPVNMQDQFFQKLYKNRKRLQVVNGVLYRQFFDHTGLESHKQLVVPEDCILKIIRTLHNSPVQGHPGLKKMLYELRKRYYSPNLACKVQKVLDGCENCMKSKSVKETQLRPPLQKIYDPCDGPEDLLEIDIVGPLPASNGFTHILTAVDVFSRYLFAVPLKRPDTHSVVRGLLSIFTKHAYVPKHILTDKGTAFTAELLSEIAKAADIHISHATIKHAQTIGMVERTHAKLKKILKISVNADRPQWDRYVDIGIMAHNTTYHDSLKCSPTEIFHGRTPYNSLDLQFRNANKPAETKCKDVNEILDKMNFIFRDNLDNIISAYHKYKTYYDRKARAQPLKVNEFVFLLDPKYDSQRSKEEFKTFHWKGPYKVIKVLSDSNYIIRKVSTHQTQCVHRMRLRLFKPEFPIDDINVSKHLYPDTERVEDTDIFDSNIPTTDEVDQNENDTLDQDLVEDEPSAEIVPPVQERHSPQVFPPQITTRIEYQQVETDHNNFRPPTVRFGTREEIILPPPRDESRIRVPLRDEQHENQSQQTNTQNEDEERMSSRPSRSNQSRYRLRENPTPKTYPDFLIHEITSARNALRKTNKIDVTI